MTGILIEFLVLFPILLLMALGVFAPFLALGLLFWRWHRESRFRDLGDGRDGTQMLGKMEL
jgi:hypothetical protein